MGEQSGTVRRERKYLLQGSKVQQEARGETDTDRQRFESHQDSEEVFKGLEEHNVVQGLARRERQRERELAKGVVGKGFFW